MLGKDKGRTGEVLRVLPDKARVLVKGLNLFKKHVKPSQGQKGGIVEKERSLPVSSVSLICPSCKKTARIGYLVDKKGDKNRVCKKCQAVLPASKK